MNSFLITISLVAVFDVIGSMIAKMWMLKSNPIYLIGTFICFGIAGLFFANSLKFEGVGIANIIWTILSIIIVSTAGYFFFNENMNYVQIFGVFVMIAGLVLVNVK